MNGDIPDVDPAETKTIQPTPAKPVNSEPVPKSAEEMALEDEQFVEKKISNVKNPKLSNVGHGTPIEQLSFVSPLQGEISEHMSLEKNHLGVDVIVPKNTEVKSIMDGYVISADWTQETGNSILVRHANDVLSVYRHNSRLLKKAGDYIKAGEVLAIAGNSGEQTNGPHLHFELWYQGKAVNPENYIRF